MNRKRFLASAGALTLATWLPAQTSSVTDAPKPKAPDKGPPLAPELVKEFVGAAHSNLEKTKALLAGTPSLLNATWDWGGGDFETGLGGAAHMGNREIAEFLLSSGARLDIFAAAMLGKLDVVKAACAAFPGTPQALGPHKIPLLNHAVKGGPAAAAVVDYLKSLTVAAV